MSADNRTYPRRDLEHPAFVKIRCSLTDISRTGARLSVDDPKSLPNEFLLEIRTDLARRCRVIWRTDKHVGVEYIAADNRESAN